jgi:hypothetical protein
MKLLDFGTISLTEARSLAQADYLAIQSPQGQIKQVLRQSIHEALQTAKDLNSAACLTEIRDQLDAIQVYCKMVNKAFIVVEESITCDCYGLGGRCEDAATLFRGPSENASVAICVTHKGSLLYRNGTAWRVYKDVGDIDPAAEVA